MGQEESCKASQAVLRTRSPKFCTVAHASNENQDASEVGFHVRQKLIITCFHMFVHALVLFEPSLSPCFEPFPLAFEFEMVRGQVAAAWCGIEQHRNHVSQLPRNHVKHGQNSQFKIV